MTDTSDEQATEQPALNHRVMRTFREHLANNTSMLRSGVIDGAEFTEAIIKFVEENYVRRQHTQRLICPGCGKQKAVPRADAKHPRDRYHWECVECHFVFEARAWEPWPYDSGVAGLAMVAPQNGSSTSNPGSAKINGQGHLW